MALPTARLAGEHDARTVAFNPGGLAAPCGKAPAAPEMALVLGPRSQTLRRAATGFRRIHRDSGGGVGSCAVRVGVGFEWLRPARSQLTPDPGRPFRFTLGSRRGWAGARAGRVVAPLSRRGCADGVDTFDLGLSTRIGNHCRRRRDAAGYRDEPVGDTPDPATLRAREVIGRSVSTRSRPRSAGGSGDAADVDGWARVSARVMRRRVRPRMFETRGCTRSSTR